MIRSPTARRARCSSSALSKSLGLPYRPLVIATGGALTDVADAYLVDHTVTERVVIVSSLGSTTSTGGGMGIPTETAIPGPTSSWPPNFATCRSAPGTTSSTDVPSSSLSELPNNALGAWIASKQPNLWQWSPASDQVAVLAVGLPSLRDGDRTRVCGRGVDAGATAGPNLATESKRSRLARHRVRRNRAGNAVLERLARHELIPVRSREPSRVRTLRSERQKQ